MTTPNEEITVAEIATVEKTLGLSYTEENRALMTKRVTQNRDALRAVRRLALGEREEPASLFDPRLPGMPLPQATERTPLRVSEGDLPPYDGNPESLAFLSATDLSRLLQARKITSVELTRMYLNRLKRFGPRLHCVINLTEKLAMQQAKRADAEIAQGIYRSSLQGIPWGAKDLLATKGFPTTWGVKPYEKRILNYDATVVERLDAAGAVLVAKLSVGELAMGDVWFGGKTRNPWNPKRGSSGSSAGSGSATAAGLVGFSIGTETLGSIVSPSVENGVTGLRPTFGRVPRYGAMALCWTLDKIGPMCRSVEDCALVFDAIHGADGRDRTAIDAPFVWNPTAPLSELRVGIDSRAFQAIEKRAKRTPAYDVLATLERLGVSLRPISLPKKTPAYKALSQLIIEVESSASFAQLTASPQIDALVQQTSYSWPNVFRVGSLIPATDYLLAMRARRRLQEEMAAVFADIDCYVTIPFAGVTLQYTNLTGHPSLVTRCGMLDGLPQSIEFIGGLYQEAALLRLGYAYEQATEWRTQWPDTENLPSESAIPV